jgi:hypothetical protein
MQEPRRAGLIDEHGGRHGVELELQKLAEEVRAERTELDEARQRLEKDKAHFRDTQQSEEARLRAYARAQGASLEIHLHASAACALIDAANEIEAALSRDTLRSRLRLGMASADAHQLAAQLRDQARSLSDE